MEIFSAAQQLPQIYQIELNYYEHESNQNVLMIFFFVIIITQNQW